MEQITNEMLDRIFAAYWGCKTIICYPSSNFPQYSVVDKLFHKSLQDKMESLATHYKWNKLILKPLSSISDEDAKEVAKMYPWFNWYVDAVLEVYKNQFGDTVVSNEKRIGRYETVCLKYSEPSEIELNQKQTDYLRSRSYDCGYGNIPSLITAQIAISI